MNFLVDDLDKTAEILTKQGFPVYKEDIVALLKLKVASITLIFHHSVPFGSRFTKLNTQ